jgi:hypothetical protein
MIHLLRSGIRCLAAFAVAAALVGCNSDKKPATDDTEFKNYCDLPKPCQDLAQTCHPKDDGTPGKIHECHETGHDVGTLEACMAVYDDCIAACKAAPALSDGPVEDLGAHCHKDASP